MGPATASLLLSVAFPSSAVFFSDEAYAWSVADPDGSRETGKAGKVKIGYTKKEYGEVCAKMEAIRERLGARVVEVEKAAFVVEKVRMGAWTGSEPDGEGIGLMERGVGTGVRLSTQDGNEEEVVESAAGEEALAEGGNEEADEEAGEAADKLDVEEPSQEADNDQSRTRTRSKRTRSVAERPTKAEKVTGGKRTRRK